MFWPRKNLITNGAASLAAYQTLIELHPYGPPFRVLDTSRSSVREEEGAGVARNNPARGVGNNPTRVVGNNSAKVVVNNPTTVAGKKPSRIGKKMLHLTPPRSQLHMCNTADSYMILFSDPDQAPLKQFRIPEDPNPELADSHGGAKVQF